MLPDYWMERPPLEPSPATRDAIDEFLLRASEAEGLVDVDALLAGRDGVTPWQFLCGVAEHREIAFHGTGDPHIATFEPREPIDFAPFGAQKAVFATTDPIWAMFYAVVDRARYRLTICNGCILVTEPDGSPRLPHYFFSVTATALPERPWRTGWLYFLPAETFVAQPGATYGRLTARIPQLASPVPVTPFARLRIRPDDFPFLAQIRGHDDERLGDIAQAVMSAGPWPT